jgi:hypothetical protein
MKKNSILDKNWQMEERSERNEFASGAAAN